MSQWIGLLIRNSYYSGIFILAVLLMRLVLQHRLPSRIYKGLWMLVFIRLFMPILPSSRFSVETVIPIPRFTGILPISRTLIVGFTILWTVAAVASLLITAASYRIMKKKIRAAPLCRDERVKTLVEDACKQHGLNKIPEIRYYAGSTVPCVTGVFKPVLLLPENITADALYYVARHEIAHICSKDILKNLSVLSGVMIHWFNPLVWLAIRYYRIDSESACDEKVLDRLDRTQICKYGQTIIDSAVGAQTLCPGFRSGARELDSRIKALTAYGTRSRLIISLVLALTLVLTAIFFTTV
ncbi:MAG TPA: hypothetical protein DD727_08635 [Clostridiales bacterium]|nr:hypothetical protein [Clostridiales bacterium]